MFLLKIFSRRWIAATVVVLVGIYVMVSLGFWQLRRLEQRRALNRLVTDKINLEPMPLDAGTLAGDLNQLEYRRVTVTGVYDHSQQVALKNQFVSDSLGVHLLTPLKIAGADQAVLIDRGWIPYDHAESQYWGAYDEPGEVTVMGIVYLSQTVAQLNMLQDPTLTPRQDRLEAWNMVNIDRISQQMSMPLAGVFVQQFPDDSWKRLPYRNPTQLEISEGSHLSYAVQWFSFALFLAVGYPYYVRKQEKIKGG